MTATTWFASWFDSPYYHRLYAGRNDSEAAGFIDALIARLRPRAGADMLDLGCGAGRHAKYLASKGFMVTGLDLAAGSISAAKRSAPAHLRFRRHDMRQPFGVEAFDYVFSFFTSFGYFDEPAEDAAVVANIATSLTNGGTVVLDYLNVRHAEATLTPAEVRQIDGVTYRLTRWTDDRHFFKRIVIEDGTAGAPLEFTERVARLTLPDIQRLFEARGLIVDEVYGDYRLGDFDPLNSPRMIVVATKPADADAIYLRDRFLRMRLSVSGEMPRYDASIH